MLKLGAGCDRRQDPRMRRGISLRKGEIPCHSENNSDF